MKVSTSLPEIVRFTYLQERGDPNFGTCLWAHFDFDEKENSLSIQSDCGCYGGSWFGGLGKQSFMEFVSRISRESFLKKLCRESVVDWESTKERVKEALLESDASEDDIEEAIEDLDALEDDYDMEDDIGAATIRLEEWNEDHLDICDIFEYVRTDYTKDQKKIADIFERHIQPAIREGLKNMQQTQDKLQRMLSLCEGDTEIRLRTLMRLMAAATLEEEAATGSETQETEG